MNPDEEKHGPGVKMPPPLVVLAVMAAAYGFHQWIPLCIPKSAFLSALGLVLVGIGMLILVVSLVQFFQQKTAIEPWKPATRLIQTGLYRYSRNPIYLAFYLIQVGGGLFLSQGWMVITVMITEGWIYRLVIKKEEAYLERRFGEEYRHYKSKVRRYI